jgi:hypothetical protein
VIDEVRADAVDEAPELYTAIDTGPLVLDFLRTLLDQVSALHPLVAAVAAARVIDDLWAPLLISAWVPLRLERGAVVSRGDLVMIPGDECLAALYPGWSLAAAATRAAERPDHTAHALLFDPGDPTPVVRISAELDAHLDEALLGAVSAAACVPDSRFADLRSDFPVRPLKPEEHEQRCVALVQQAIDIGASIVVLPEFAGYSEVTDALRRLRPSRPVLIVAGSGHIAEGNRKLNRSLFWVARPTGPVPAAKPLSVLKRVPYEGALGSEPLTELGEGLTIHAAGPWRLAVGICRDLLAPTTLTALWQLGVNLLVVPACSAKTSNLAANTSLVASNVPGIAIVANGPKWFPGTTGGESGSQNRQSDVEVPTGIYTAPIDRVEPRLMASSDAPGLALFRLAEHRVEVYE